MYYFSILHDKKVMAAYAGRMSVPQFEAKCHGVLYIMFNDRLIISFVFHFR